MTAKEAKRLSPGTVVMWDGNPYDWGTVRELSTTGFYVDWADGQYGWIDYKGATRVQRKERDDGRT